MPEQPTDALTPFEEWWYGRPQPFGTPKKHAEQAWAARQPEIDALRARAEAAEARRDELAREIYQDREERDAAITRAEAAEKALATAINQLDRLLGRNGYEIQ